MTDDRTTAEVEPASQGNGAERPGADGPGASVNDVPATAGGDGPRSSRRALLAFSARRMAYASPVVLLFRPSQALAGSGGSGASNP